MSLNREDRLLQKTLSDWQGWSISSSKKPVVVSELKGGKTNRSFLVETTYEQVVVRINAANGRSLGVDRRQEAEILSRLQILDCVPKIFFISDQVLVSEYIPGRCWDTEDLKKKDQLRKLSNLVEDLQGISLPENITQRNYVAYCQHYIQQLSVVVRQSEREFIERVHGAAKTIDEAHWKPVINHHDLVPENIIESERGLFLLDWEYAAYGHPGIDFIRLYGEEYSSFVNTSTLMKELLTLQQGIDKLWSWVNY